MPLTPQYGYYILSAVIAIGGSLKWLLRSKRRSDIEHVFIRDMASNHLPHIYTALELIGDKLDVPIAKAPQIKFLDNKDFEG